MLPSKRRSKLRGNFGHCLSLHSKPHTFLHTHKCTHKPKTSCSADACCYIIIYFLYDKYRCIGCTVSI